MTLVTFPDHRMTFHYSLCLLHYTLTLIPNRWRALLVMFLYKAQKMFNKFLMNEFIFLLVFLMIKNPHFQNDGLSDSPRPGCPNQLLASANPHTIYKIWPVHSPQTCRYKMALTQSLWYLFPPMNQPTKFYPQVFYLASHWSSLTHRFVPPAALPSYLIQTASGLHCQKLINPFEQMDSCLASLTGFGYVLKIDYEKFIQAAALFV